MTPDSPPTPRDDAIRLLARREYAAAELLTRLVARGHEPAVAEAAIARLAEEGLQSDARFVEHFVRSRIQRGQGPVKVRAELGRRGVDGELIGTALGDADCDWHALACEVLAKRFDGPGDGPRERARRQRFLAGRGFDADQVHHALAHAWHET